jgi:hypothetical protein
MKNKCPYQQDCRARNEYHRCDAKDYESCRVYQEYKRLDKEYGLEKEVEDENS